MTLKHRLRSPLPSLATALFLLGMSTLEAAEIPVTPGQTAEDHPLAEALERAKPGDTITLAPGIYREHIHITQPITLKGQPGVILDGSTPFEGNWKADGEKATILTTTSKDRVYGLLVDGKFVAELRYERARKEGDWHWKTLLEKGPPLSKFEQIRALWMYHPGEGKIYAHFENDSVPQIALVRKREPLIRVSKTSGVTLEGLELRGAFTAVQVDEAATGCRIVRCKISSFEKCGILLTGGASGCVVEECNVTRGAFEDWSPKRELGRVNYEIWRIHKDVGHYDREGINLDHAGAGNRILRNHVHRSFDGITLGDSSAESLDIPLPDPDHGRDTEIAGNLIEETRDSGIELGVGCINVNVHGNTLRNTHGGLRFKLPRIGPVFIHHNRLLGGAPFNIWFSMDSSPAEGYIYHNTIVGGDSAIKYLSFNNHKRGSATPKWHVLNNLVLGKDGFFERGNNTPPPDFIAAGNVCDHDNRPWPDDKNRDKANVYGASIKHDEKGKPAPGSAAINAGIDLTTYWKGKPLPGCQPGYFQGKAPDAGMDEIE